MGYSLMRWLRYTLLAAALLLAGLWASVRLIPRWQARDLTPIMTAYLRAAAAGDSGALVQVTVSPTPVNWALLVHHKAPAFMERAASQGRAEFVRFHGDTAILSFRLATPVPDLRHKPLHEYPVYPVLLHPFKMQVNRLRIV